MRIVVGIMVELEVMVEVSMELRWVQVRHVGNEDR